MIFLDEKPRFTFANFLHLFIQGPPLTHSAVEQRCVVSSTWHTSLPGGRQFWTFPRADRVGGLRAQKFVSRNPGTYPPTKIPFFVRFARGVNQLLWAWWQSDVAFIESPQRRICKTWAISGTVSRKMSSNCARCLTQPKTSSWGRGEGASE